MTSTRNATTITATPGTPFLDTERTFDAPVADVFRAYTDPALVVQWLGPSRNAMRVEHWHAVTGGSYRYVHITPDGTEQLFRGSFHSVEADVRVISTFEWAGAPDQVSLDSVEFVDLGGARTTVRGHSVFPTVGSLEAALTGGMLEGMTESYDRLAALVTTA